MHNDIEKDRAGRPDSVLLFTASGCVHCAAMKMIFQKLFNNGLVKSFDAVDLAAQPELVSKYAVKSVPWFMLGNYSFQGVYSEKEICDWISQLNSQEGRLRYFQHALTGGRLQQVIAMAQDDHSILSDLLELITDPVTNIKVRLGVSAVFEEFEGSPVLKNILTELIQLARNPEARVRADAAHYLSLTHDDSALLVLQELANDKDHEVREIASDAINTLE